MGILTHPAFQSAAAPLLGSLVAALMLRRAGFVWQGFAVLVGMTVAVMLITGLNLQPLTSTRKIVLCSLVLPFAALILRRSTIDRVVFLALTMAATAVWVVWPVLMRQPGLEAWLIGGRVGLFAAAVGAGLVWFGHNDWRHQGGAMLGLGLGVGATVLVAASALYGQLGFAVAAATGGLLLVRLRQPSPGGLGDPALFAAAVPLGLIGGAATVYAQLPSLVLLLLAAVPICAAIPVPGRNPWLRLGGSSLLALVPVVPAVWLTWQEVGAVNF
jgi:hypothetical protein